MSIRTPSRRPPAARVALAAVAACVACASACGPKRLPPPVLVSAPAPPPERNPPANPPAWTYWEPIEVAVRGTAVSPPLPLAEADLATPRGALARWAALSPGARAAVLERGFAVVPRGAPTARFGRAYAALAEADVPYVVTLDALFWVAHVARDRGLAAVENAVLAPQLETLLGRLEVRLASDAHGAPSDLLAPFVLARGVVSVARSLLSPAYQPPVDLARVVGEENRRIAAHDGPSLSPLLGVTVDYSQMVPRGDSDASAARAAYARAVAWLDSAPFVLAARGEVEGAELSIASARTHTRAALLLARLVDFNVDVEAANAWHQWNALAELSGGATDDVPLRALLETAALVGMNARGGETAPPGVRSAGSGSADRAFVDVAKIDRLRHTLLATRAARLDDGTAIAGVVVRPPLARAPGGEGPTPVVSEMGAARDFTRAATSVRVFPGRAPADAEVLQSLVFPSVGSLLPSDGGAPPETARDGIRALPRALDIGAWLGDLDARALLRESGDDAYERYEQTLGALVLRRPAQALLHDSLYASSLDALATYLAPSAADPSQPGAASLPWRRRKLEGVLAGWATLRHDALAFARFPLATAPTTPPAAPSGARSGENAFVEVHPEAIAKLLSLVRQTARGLRALGQIPADSPANPILDAAEGILVDALAVARREADDLPLAPGERAAMATLPDRLAALEASLVPSRAADASLAIDVHTDLPSQRTLVEAAGDLDDLYLAFREPQTGRIVLALGATASHYEVTEHARDRTTDTVWRARLHGPSPPARADYTSAFLVQPASPEPLDASAPTD